MKRYIQNTQTDHHSFIGNVESKKRNIFPNPKSQKMKRKTERKPRKVHPQTTNRARTRQGKVEMKSTEQKSSEENDYIL
ncbi:hypothetical protein T10_6673 [Trichinella papuae]|uniref:Uncharacterized protein n=1 Tax=Trichinella papuae TaxID=268474 RepID=A0A0V1N414_9BILA|nr:hypothetical protein T10_6673 [Trichinella papuae]